MLNSKVATDRPGFGALTYSKEALSVCPNCRSERIAHWCEPATDKMYQLTRDVFSYDICKNCSSVFLNPRPVERDIAKFYPDDYGPHQPDGSAANDQDSAWPSNFTKIIIKLLASVSKSADSVLAPFFPDILPSRLDSLYAPPFAGALLLDYGCGSDQFLNKARALGWKTLGLDFSENAVNQTKKSGHDVRLIAPEVWRQIPDASVSCVRLNHVLEHLYQPKETLAMLVRKMAPGARLHIAVPNPASLSARIFRRNWRGLDCPRHVVLYPPKALIALVQAAGLTRITTVGEIHGKDFSGSLGYRLNEKGKISELEAVNLKSNPLLNELMRAPMRLASHFGFPDRIHLFAELPPAASMP